MPPNADVSELPIAAAQEISGGQFTDPNIVGGHTRQFVLAAFRAYIDYRKIQPLLLPPEEPPQKPIGFGVREARARYGSRR